jgi:hypothetical protein
MMMGKKWVHQLVDWTVVDWASMKDSEMVVVLVDL